MIDDDLNVKDYIKQEMKNISLADIIEFKAFKL